jgi:hypothetical protein
MTENSCVRLAFSVWRGACDATNFKLRLRILNPTHFLEVFLSTPTGFQDVAGRQGVDSGVLRWAVARSVISVASERDALAEDILLLPSSFQSDTALLHYRLLATLLSENRDRSVDRLLLKRLQLSIEVVLCNLRTAGP